VSSWTSGALAADVFQMTILGKGREEYFRIWPGARTNRVEAEGIDPERRQLVLMVHEPVRAFEEQPSKGRVELDALASALRGIRTIVRRSCPIGRGGNPHVADELVVVPAKVVGKKLVARAVFAQGRVRHATVYLSSWAKVVRNTEPVADDGIARMDGIRWVD
jgi:hypothetical protein